MNPFRKSPSPLRPLRAKDQKKWVCPSETWNKLDELVSNDENLVILGVEGSGKTTLLNWFFTAAYCARAAQEGRLVFFADLSDTENAQELCSYLITQLSNAARKYLDANGCEALEGSLQKSSLDRETPKRTFINACERLYEQGYTILLVMDGFERFVSSPYITQEQHEMLRGLLDKDIMRCVVATNYDLERSSLPEDVAGSLYLQKFQQKITMRGFTQTEAEQFVSRHIGPEAPVQFTQKQIDYIMTLTGGIPALFELAANHMYEMLEKQHCVKVGDLRVYVYDAARPIMKSWCKFFTQNYEEVIRNATMGLADNRSIILFHIPLTNETSSTAATRLSDRGLLNDDSSNTYCFNSGLLQTFFYNHEYKYYDELSDMVSPPEPPAAPAPDPAQSLLNPEAGKSIIIYQPNINGDIHLGNTINHTTNNTVLATKELLGLLTSAEDSREGFAQALYARMAKMLPEQGLVGIERGQGMTDAEFDSVYDSAFENQISNKVVDVLAVDEDEELVEITDEEQMTLDRRFEEAKKAIRPKLTDEMLNKVSARTGFYLKLSVVVEDALSILKLLHANDSIDCSAQLILYGKAIEQQLKDSFYPLFHRESHLRNYRIKAEGAGVASFQNTPEERTCIGNYMHAIGDQGAYLSRLCVDNNLTRNGAALTDVQWNTFWAELKNKINEARVIRNLSAHTNRNKVPGWAEVDRLVQLCFEMDSDSIFDNCVTGRDLSTVLFGTGHLRLAEGKALEGTGDLFHCTKVKTNGGLDGYLERSQCQAKISPAQVKQYRKRHPDHTFAPQQTYNVRLLEYREQNNALFFAAELAE